jgi:hypothetical protein
MMKKLLSIALGLVTTLSFAQTFVSTSPENQKVVLEEFTGIYCGYCPDGHVIGQGLHDASPNEVFLINIHTGGYSNPNGPADPDFNSPYGAWIAGNSGLAGYPAGTVNRSTFQGIAPQGSAGTTALSRGDWAAAATIVMGMPSPVNVAAQASFDMGTGILSVNTETYYTSNVTNSNNLHVAVVGNNIPGPQSGAQSYNPGAIISGPWSPTYNHQHMLLHLMDGQNGLEFNTTTAGTFIPNTHTWTVPATNQAGQTTTGYFPALDPTNMDVVAFITDGSMGSETILTGFQANVIPVFPNAYDANVTASSAADVVCASETDIEITFRNYGNQPLTSLDLNYKINSGTIITYGWTGNLTSGAQETVLISNVAFTPQANNTVDWTASNPNGQTDQNANNNASSSTFNHAFLSGNVVDGINAGLIDIAITTDGYGSETTWDVTAEDGSILASGGPYGSNVTLNETASVGASECFTFNLYDSYGDGMCCTNGVGSVMVTDASGNVIFEGDPVTLQNFTAIPAPFSTGLASGDAWECTPFGCADVGAGFGSYASETDCEADPTTGCYVVSSIDENQANLYELYPNPAKDVLSIDGTFKSIEIYDVFGKLVLASDNKSEINISDLANGSYYVNIHTENSVIKKKVTVSK